jgi:hypothetical protein
MGARWRGHSHPELYEMINNGPGAGASHEQTAYWRALTDELSQVDADLNKALTDLKVTWTGAAADGANTSMTPLQQWSGDATSGSNLMRVSAEDQADFISRARAEMPHPVEVTTPQPSAWQLATAGASMMIGNPGPAAVVAIQAGDHERQEAAQNAAADKAVDTMNNYESSSVWNRNTLGTFVAPPDVVVDTPPPRGEGTGNPNGPGGWSNNFAYNPSTTTTSGSIHTPPSPPGAGNGSLTGPNPPGATPGNVGVNPLPPGPPRGDFGTDPSNVVPVPVPPPSPLPNPPLPPGPPPGPPTTGPGWGPGLPPLSTNLPFGGGDSTRPGAPGAQGGRPGGPGMPPGLGGMDADGRSSAQLGRGGVAGLGPAGVEGVATRGGAGGAVGGGRGGAGMHGGPMGAGGAMQREEDDEHSAPDYLLETTDVFGDDRMVSPAVIGEDPTEAEK